VERKTRPLKGEGRGRKMHCESEGIPFLHWAVLDGKCREEGLRKAR